MQCSADQCKNPTFCVLPRTLQRQLGQAHRHHILQQKCLWPTLEQHVMGSADNPLQSSQLKEGWVWGKERSSEQMDLAHINGLRSCSHFLFIQYDLTPLEFNAKIHNENGTVYVPSYFSWFCAAMKFHGDYWLIYWKCCMYIFQSYLTKNGLLMLSQLDTGKSSI